MGSLSNKWQASPPPPPTQVVAYYGSISSFDPCHAAAAWAMLPYAGFGLTCGFPAECLKDQAGSECQLGVQLLVTGC
jgi:hypothetical protein